MPGPEPAPPRRRGVGASAKPGGVELQVELACNGLFGAQERPIELQGCELALFDPAAWQLFYDFETLRSLYTRPGSDPSVVGDLMRAELYRFCNEPDAAILAALYERRNGTTHARDHGDRPRTPRHGVALAARGDLSQGHPDVLHAACAT